MVKLGSLSSKERAFKLLITILLRMQLLDRGLEMDKGDKENTGDASPPVKVQRLSDTRKSPLKSSSQDLVREWEDEVVPDILAEKLKYIRSVINSREPLFRLSDVFIE